MILFVQLALLSGSEASFWAEGKPSDSSALLADSGRSPARI
jgi:hypothetical protein